MRMRILAAIFLAAFMSSALRAQEDTALETQLQTLVQAHHGNVTLFAHDLNSGKTVAIHPDTPVPTASVIKLTVLFEALKQIQEGKAHFDDKLTLTLKDVLTMMVIVSDNTATNLAIDHLGLKNIDDRIQWLGLKDTWLYKKVSLPPVGPMPADQKQFGLGKTTAREMADVMERFATCNLNARGSAAKPTESDQKLCAVAMHMLKSQFYRNSIPR